MPHSIRVAALQMTSTDDVRDNHRQAIHLLEEAAARGAEIAFLPETWTYMGEQSGAPAAAEPIPGPTTDLLTAAARRHGMAIHGGSFVERDAVEPRVFNTSVVIDASGAIVTRYRKIHLFDVGVEGGVVYQESASVAPGSEPVIAGVAGLSLGLTICYDLRFPELYRLLALDGAEMIAVPAAFHQYTGKDHWEVLLRARAIENQVYIVAAQESGRHPGGWVSYGRSMIVDPWGTVLATAPDGAGLAVADCDLETLARVRRELPSLANRRPAAYHRTGDVAPIR